MPKQQQLSDEPAPALEPPLEQLPLPFFLHHQHRRRLPAPEGAAEAAAAAAGPLPLAVAADTGAARADGQRQSRVAAAHRQSHQHIPALRLSGHIDACGTLQ